MFLDNYHSPKIELFKCIQDFGPITKKDIISKLGLKLTSLNRIIKPLIDEKLVIEVGIAKSNGGRKPALYDLNTNILFLIGVDLSRTHLKIVITNLKGDLLGKKFYSMDTTYTPTKVVKVVSTSIDLLLIEQNLSQSSILGIGLGTVGPLDTKNGIMLNPQKFQSQEWNQVNIKTMIESYTGYNVLIENGANTAISIEKKYGAGKSFYSVAYFNCGIGIRTSIITANGLLRNNMNYEDTFAHMVVDINGLSCSCGKNGCIEAYSTIDAVIKQYKKLANIEEITFNQICLKANKGDIIAIDVLKHAATIFGIGLANFILLINPELIILGGPMVQFNPYFYDLCTKIALNNHSKTQIAPISFSNEGHYKSDAIAVGAALLVINLLVDG